MATLPHIPGGASLRQELLTVPYTGGPMEGRLQNSFGFTSVSQLVGAYNSNGVSMYTGNVLAAGPKQLSVGVNSDRPYATSNREFATLSGISGSNASGLGYFNTTSNIISAKVTESVNLLPEQYRVGSTGTLVETIDEAYPLSFTREPGRDCNTPPTFPLGTFASLLPNYVANSNGTFEFGILLSPILRASLGELSGLVSQGFQYAPVSLIDDAAYTIAISPVAQPSLQPYQASTRLSVTVNNVAQEYAYYRGKYLASRSAGSPDII